MNAKMGLGQMERVTTDVLVIGGGGAGARAAIEASDHGASVVMALKGQLGRSGATAYPVAEYAGFQASDGCDPLDSPEDHFRDIMEAAQGMCNPRLARIVAEESPGALRSLEAFGVPFLRDDRGRHVTGTACFSTRSRSHRILGHGEPIVAALARQIKARPICLEEETMAASLLIQDGQCIGALAMNMAARWVAHLAKATILATGGAGQLFKTNLNPGDITGDGYVMAYRAGADLVNMEFMQSGFAISRPLTLLGAWTWSCNPTFTNSAGEEFLPRYLPGGVTPSQVFEAKAGHYPFSSRDLSKYLEISVLKEMKQGRQVFFDLRNSERLEEMKRRPLYPWLAARGLDLAKEPAPIAIFAHAVNGGILINEQASSTVPGLFAAGEVAGGPHGADRLGGNMLATCQVFGARAGKYAALYAKESDRPALRRDTLEGAESGFLAARKSSGKKNDRELKKEIQNLMFESLVIERSGAQLAMALRHLDVVDPCQTNLGAEGPSGACEALEIRNLVEVAKIMARASILREESRGSHYRTDFPEKNDERWNRCIITRLENGIMKQSLITLGNQKD